jgi:translation initiation factor IF-1
MNEYTEFTHDGPITASITLAEGSATVTAHEGDQVLVEIKPAQRKSGETDAADLARVEFEGGHLRIVAPEKPQNWLFKKSIGVHVAVKLPVGSDVAVKTTSAPINLHGRLGPVSINTVAGSATVEQAASVRANTVSGSISVMDTGDEFRAHTASGQVRADHIGGDFSAKTVAGAVVAEKVDGSASVNTLSGAIELGALKSGVCRANTVSGRISLGVVAGTDVWMDLDAKAGTVTSELAAGDTSPAPSDGGTSLEVRARSVSGDIYLHRANAYT